MSLCLVFSGAGPICPENPLDKNMKQFTAGQLAARLAEVDRQPPLLLAVREPGLSEFLCKRVSG